MGPSFAHAFWGKAPIEKVEPNFFFRNFEWFFWIFIIALFISFIRWLSTSAQKRAKRKAELTDQQIQSLRHKILVVTSSTIPGKDILEVLGNVTGISKTAASTDKQFRLAASEAMLEIMNQAIKIGANGIIDLQMTTGSYQQQGSKWMVSKTTYNGTAVKYKE